MKKPRSSVATFVALASVAMLPTTISAQAAATDIGGLRAYVHVFIAYAIAIALIFGWVISIGRRLKDVERHLGD